MVEIWNLMWIVPFCLGLGFIFAEVSGEWNRKCAEIKQVRKEPENEKEPTVPFNDKPDPMSLRNGMNVTRDENPTFAEQWVNIMNYNGENQKEEDYEESENDGSEEDLG